MTKPKRVRTEKREVERELRKTARALEKAALASPGGSPEHAIPVPTVSVIETRAFKTPCPLCEGELELLEHAAEVRRGVQLRAVRMQCLRCHVKRTLWFRLQPTFAN